MSKPSWDAAPSWAEWLAMDQCGDWNWYREMPFGFKDNCGRWLVSLGSRVQQAGHTETWVDTLESRPEVVK